jgi:imidazolonepropionase-like amidohydrolase/Tol biopolymer transport system component
MHRTSARRLRRVPLLAVALAAASPAAAQNEQAADSTRRNRNPIQEGLPLAPARTVEFTATEGSWLSVDVSPDGRTLVFDLLGDLYTMPATGGRATPLTQGMAFDAQPRFSPDGRRVVFTSDRNGGEGVWMLSLDLKDTVQVTRGKTDKYESPEFTPDGQYVLFTKNYRLHMAHVDGGAGIQLIREPAGQGGGGGGGLVRYMGAAFGDDPRYVWTARRTGVWQYNTALPDYQLVVYDRDTGETSTRSSRPGSAFRPTLSPDGRWLVYGTRYAAETGLRIRDLETGNERWLAYPVQRDDQESRATLDTYPGMTFTPDSRSLIAFYGGKLWSIPVDGSAPTNIPFEVNVRQHIGPHVEFDYPIEDSPTFAVRQIRDSAPSPDGRRLAFVALDRLYVTDLGAPIATTNDGDEAGAPQQAPRRLTSSDDVEYSPVWSPDGQWIAFSTWDDRDGGHIYRLRASGGDPQRLTPAPALYQDLAWTPDGARIVAVRSPAEAYTEETILGASEFVWIPAAGGDVTFIAAADGLGKPHFTRDGQRIFAYGGGRLVSMRWDGTDVRDVVRVTSPPAPGATGGGPPAALVLMAPVGDFALAQAYSDLYVVTVPRVGGEAPSISVANPENAAFPVRRLTEIGGQFPSWSSDGRKVHWSIGNAHFVYDLDRAEVVDDSVAAARTARGDTAGAAQRDTAAGGATRDRPTQRAYQPHETRITLTAARDIPRGTAVLRGARAITMRGDEVIENADIVIRDNRIVAVGPRGQVEVPADARVIDVAGRTIMPGFVDTHAHLRARGVHRPEIWAYAANLAFGVTTTRDPQTGTTDVLSYEDMVTAGQVLGPRIYSTGPGLFAYDNVRSLEHARTVLKRYSDYYHTKTIKQYVAGNREQRQWVIQAARELRLMPTTEGSLDIEMNITEAIDGYSGHEHSWPAFPLQSDLIRLFAQSGIYYTPTILVAYGGPWAENYFYATEDVLGNEKLARFTPYDELARKARRRSAGWFHEDEHVFRHIGKTVADLIAAGGKAGVGSHGQLQGLGYHWELWAMQAGGLPEHDALRVATLMGAAAIGLDNDVGSIEPGKLADLVVLTANPLENIRNTNTVAMVMMNGRLFDANTLNETYPRERAAEFYWYSPPPSPAAGIGR